MELRIGSTWRPIQGGSTYTLKELFPSHRASVMLQHDESRKESLHEVPLERLYEYWSCISEVRTDETDGT